VCCALWRQHRHVNLETSVRVRSQISWKVTLSTSLIPLFILFYFIILFMFYLIFCRLFTIHVSTWDYPGNLAKIIALAAKAELVVREIRHIRGKVWERVRKSEKSEREGGRGEKRQRRGKNKIKRAN
jgi:hypothetical protein